ncbi:MAG: FHA domain-containing protein [Acidobacteria bacterium]|nr:FHA domain-containing protein [Acidobacteriota bacterium]
MDARLLGWVRDGRRVSVPVEKELRLGAAPDNDVVVEMSDVSRKHARIVSADDGYWLEDVGSRNGTSLNGEPVTRAKLGHLDVIGLGRHVDLVFVEGQGRAAPAAIDARLEWLDGPDVGRSVPVPRGELVIGRAEGATVVIDSPAVSRAHVRLIHTGSALTAEDLGSANGTRLNGRPLSAPTPLRDGDELHIGATRRCRVRLTGVPGADARPAAAAPPPADVPTAPAAAPQVDLEWKTRLIWPGQLAVDPIPAALASPPLAASAEAPVAGGTILGAPASGPLQTPQGVLEEVGGSEPAPAAPTIMGFHEVGPQPRAAAPIAVPHGVSAGAPSSSAPQPVEAERTVHVEPSTSVVDRLTGVRLVGEVGAFTLPIGRSTIGRAPDVTVRIDSREMSRVHAVIVVTPADVLVHDQDSANGTSVNGADVKGAHPLAHGDRVAFASFEFRVELLRRPGVVT